jgi:hypothetical protein
MKLALILLIAAFTGGGTFASAQQACETLINVAAPGLQITSAALVSEGPFVLPNAAAVSP